MNIEPWLREILACPRCHASLRQERQEEVAQEAAQELVCTSERCGLAYPVQDGIPVLLVEEARKPGGQPA